MKIITHQFQTQFALILLLLMSYYGSNAQDFSKGGDVSWLPQMEAEGIKFYNESGVETDCLQLLKDKGMNTVRLRVFVNPSTDKVTGHCSPIETIALAVRAKAAGMRIMIDFHYSDTFASPGQQTRPLGWPTTLSTLKTNVYNHTFSVLTDLKTAGVIPEWVQVGNEIPGGILWNTGRTSNWGNLSQLLNQGYDATKAVDPAIKVVIHLDQGNNNTKFRTFFDNATTNNVKYDVIGMSYYPYWLGQNNPVLFDYNQTIADLQNNLNDMVTRYSKEVMVVEVGGQDNLPRNTYDMVKAVITAVKNVPNNKGLGVIYWEPQGQRSFSQYPLSAWQSNGKPSDALNAFNDLLPRPVPDEQVKIDGFALNPVEQGRSFTANLTYTANTSTHFFYVGLVLRNSDGTFKSTIVQSTNNQFLVPSVGENVSTQVSLNIPIGTVPSASLPNGEYYDVTVTLWSAGFGTKVWTTLSPQLTILPLAPATSVTSIPTSTQVGSNLVVSYKYTVATAGKVRITVTKNGGATPATFISTVASAVVNPATAGTDVTGTFTLPIPAGTAPTSSLTGNENYRVKVELLSATDVLLVEDISNINYNFTAAPAISVTSIPTSAQVGTNLVVSYKYTINSPGRVKIFVTKNGGVTASTFISNIASAVVNPAAAGIDVTGTFTLPIPAGTTPTASLTGNENYRVKVELFTATDTWIVGDYTNINYNLTSSAVVSDISVTSIPTSTKVGANLVVSYKYTVGAAARVKINVTKNGGATPSTFISTIANAVVNPAAAGTEIAGTFTLPISAATIPTISLTGNENYRIRVELFTAADAFIKGVYYTNYNFTPATATWTGASDTSWSNASNWTNGVPISVQDVVIAAAANQPNIATNVAIKSLLINATASLTVNADFNLTVTDAITNNGTLTIENNANLLQGGTTNTNTGNVIVKRNSNALHRSDYSLWSSPVTGTQTLAQFSPLTLQSPNRFYTYNSSSDLYINASPASTFVTGTGYLIRMPNTDPTTNYNAGTAALNFPGVFIGKPNNGNISVTTVSNKFNGVGNPYPSVIDANLFKAANTDINTLYFWRKTNNPNQGTSPTTSYAVYNIASAIGIGVAPDGVATGEPKITPDKFIQVGQGFIVETAQTSIIFNNGMRVSNNGNKFLKTKQIEKSAIWLNLSNPSWPINQMAVSYIEGASVNLDETDSKYINDSPIALTSNINNQEYIIQGRPTFDATDIVALNFKTNVAGIYTIALDHFDGVFANGQDVYLLDSKTSVETDLKAGPYTFEAEVGVDNARFLLKYQKTLKVDAPAFDENSVNVYSNNGMLYVNSANVAISNIKVFDVQGRLLSQHTNLNSKTATIKGLQSNQILIVKIVGEDNSELSKKILN